MKSEENLVLSPIESDEKKTFRTIHYLGSKLRVLDFIKNVVDEVDPDKGGVCDLFSGSGSVTQHLSSERKVISVDIQQYSNVICSALLNPVNDSFIDSFTDKVKDSGRIEHNLNLFKDIVRYEDSVINGGLSNDLEFICDFLENASLYSALASVPKVAKYQLTDALKSTVKTINSIDSTLFLATKYFGGLYFSYKQALILDAILNCINDSEEQYQNILLAAFLSTASDIVNTVGKQFAQPIRPRDKNNTPKKGILMQLRKDRNLDVLLIYKNWLNKYSQITPSRFEHEAIKMDFSDALDYLDKDISVVYADPPYTRDHYSRFYHGLETLSLMDHPIISKTNIGGVHRLSRGLYREERHQSEFCIRSKAPKAFEVLFKKVSEKNKILLLSYSPYDKSKGAHPRVVELDFLKSLASKYFDNVEIRSPGKFSHSKLNRLDLHLDSEDVAEVLLVCRN